MSSMESCLEKIYAINKTIIMEQTWGHLNAQRGSTHNGWFVFINGQHGDSCVVESSFNSFGEGPEYFNHRQDFILKETSKEGSCSKTGIYKFTGEYSVLKNGEGRFKGKIKKLNIHDL